MSDFHSAFKIISSSIVGIGLRHDPEYQIFGTGFIVHPDGWILTNQHVIKPLIIEVAEGKIGVRTDAAAFLFYKVKPESGFVAVKGYAVNNITQVAYPPGERKSTKEVDTRRFRGIEPKQIILQEQPDIGVCKINPDSLPSEALPLSPAKIIHSEIVYEGMPVGILGFPQGLFMPLQFDTRSEIQLTPLLQTGIISGILPFAGVPKPDSFVLDIHVNPGSSGSPLFLSNGTVIGIVYAARSGFIPLSHIKQNGKVKESLDTGVFIPSGLGLAIPSARFPEKWLSDK